MANSLHDSVKSLELKSDFLVWCICSFHPPSVPGFVTGFIILSGFVLCLLVRATEMLLGQQRTNFHMFGYCQLYSYGLIFAEANPRIPRAFSTDVFFVTYW